MVSGGSGSGKESPRGASSRALLTSFGCWLSSRKSSGPPSSSGAYRPLLSGLGHRHTDSSHGSISDDDPSIRRISMDLGGSSGKDCQWPQPEGSERGHGHSSPGVSSTSRSAIEIFGQAWILPGARTMLCVGLLKAVLLCALAGWLCQPMVRRYCRREPSSCHSMPSWLSGQTWIPLNDSEAVAMGKVSVFDSFLADYQCTSKARHSGHQPRFLFNTVRILDARPESAFPRHIPKPGQQVDLLVGILSGCLSADLRTAARETWQRLDPGDHGMVWHAVFIVGDCRDMLEQEQQEYGDILFTDAPETYYALTAKVLEFFDYAASIGARFVLKTDDDTFLFIDRILGELKGMKPQCLYWGSNHMGHVPSYNDVYSRDPDMPKHVLSIPSVKWYIPEADFKIIEDTWYMAGGAYVLSSDMVQKIVTRIKTVPSHLPEDATMGALLSRGAVKKCQCADSRHVKDVQEFQRIKLFKNNGGRPEALPCEISNVVYRTLSIHGMRNPSLHHEVLRIAQLPREICTGKPTPSDRRGILLSDAESYWEQIWGRKLPRMGEHSIYMQAEAYNNMVGCKKCKKDRPVPYTLLFKKQKLYNFKPNPAGFDRAFHNIVVNRTLPNVHNLLPIQRLLESKVDLPWCVRLDWAAQMAEMIVDLERQKILLCDLSLRRIYIDVSRLRPVISGGRSQWSYSQHRFHSGAWCFTDVQCHACLKPSHDDPMEWLPEAKCNKETDRCLGFDGDSQAVAFVHTVLHPLLIGNASPKGEVGRKVSKLFSGILEAKRDISSKRLGNKQVTALSKGLQSIRSRSAIRRCLKNHGPNLRMIVYWANRRRRRGLYTNYWGIPNDLE